MRLILLHLVLMMQQYRQISAIFPAQKCQKTLLSRI